MFTREIVEAVVLIVFIVSILIGGYCLERSLGEREGEKKARRRKKEKEESTQRSRWLTAHTIFAVDVDPPYENQAYDEIVRAVNLLAHLTAEACVSQDKFVRNEGTKLNHDTSWDDEVRRRKEKWSMERGFALQIAPELADRLPHFSEFEPLKSYRAEHVQKKAKKKSAA